MAEILNIQHITLTTERHKIGKIMKSFNEIWQIKINFLSPLLLDPVHTLNFFKSPMVTLPFKNSDYIMIM